MILFVAPPYANSCKKEGRQDFDKATGRDRLYGIEENPEALDELQRKLRTHFDPPIDGVRFETLHVALRDGRAGRVVLVRVPQGAAVHSIVDNGTLIRLPASNREMSAVEINELMFRRGVVSAEGQAVDVPSAVIETEHWRTYCAARELATGDTANRLLRIGLGKPVGESAAVKVWPTRAAVLLFADFPSDVLPAHGTRAGVRVFHYSGTSIEHGPNPNLKKAPQTLRGPVVTLIYQALTYVQNEIAAGFEMATSGFRTRHVYPPRVIKEAITNAVLHRDYRYPRDAAIRIFDNRIEVESPGELPFNITPATIVTARSAPRNPSLVNAARDFPDPPNVDAGAGVSMMFAEMRASGLYPPQYAVNRDALGHGDTSQRAAARDLGAGERLGQPPQLHRQSAPTAYRQGRDPGGEPDAKGLGGQRPAGGGRLQRQARHSLSEASRAPARQPELIF